MRHQGQDVRTTIAATTQLSAMFTNSVMELLTQVLGSYVTVGRLPGDPSPQPGSPGDVCLSSRDMRDLYVSGGAVTLWTRLLDAAHVGVLVLLAAMRLRLS